MHHNLARLALQCGLDHLDTAQRGCAITHDTRGWVATGYRQRDYRHHFLLAQTHFALAADLGDAEGSYRLGVLLEQGWCGTAAPGRALPCYRRAATAGLADAQYRLGMCYREGEWVEQDNGLAARWLRTAARQGHREAQYQLALDYECGLTGASRPVRAAYWYHQAAEQGHAGASFNLAWLLSQPDHPRYHLQAAIHWYTCAAQQKDRQALSNLADLLLAHPHGMAEDSRLAWLHHAGRQGHCGAQCFLARYYVASSGDTTIQIATIETATTAPATSESPACWLQAYLWSSMAVEQGATDLALDLAVASERMRQITGWR